MKRRFPGDANGPPAGRPHDPRLTAAARGGSGRLPPNNRDMGRGHPQPGRFQGRGPARPPFHQGRGPPHRPMMGRGPPGPPGRGHPPAHGMPPMRGPMGRGGMPQMAPNNFGNGNMMAGGRGPPPGRPTMPIGRGPPMPPMPPFSGLNVPPPPPRGGPMMGRGPSARHSNMHNPHPNHPPLGPPPQNIPPPPMHRNFQTQHPPPMGPPPVARLPPPPMPLQLNAFPPGSAHSRSAGHPGGPTTSYPSYSVAPGPASPAPSAPVARSVVPTQQQIDDAWKEYTAPSGSKFYHNPFLNESTYTKPDALSKNDAPTSTVKARQWQEYDDPSTGKKYYSDGVSTTWEKPPGFQSLIETLEENDEEDTKVSPKRKKRKTSLDETAYSSKEEATTGFKGFLLAKGIAPVQKWNEVAKYCSSDTRWESFGEILSVGERRQALAEYQTKRANELKNQERQERIRAKEAFGQLLTDVLQTVSGFSALNSRFSDIRAALAKDDRFHAVADEGTRESLFLDFCEELRKRDERKKRNKKREAKEAFNSFLTDREEAGTLTFASTWDLFLSSLANEEKEDARFKVSPQLTESDRQLLFADFVIELQAAEDDKRRRIRDARRRAEKAQREAYRDVLKRLAVEGRVRPFTQWRIIEEFVNLDEAFNPVLAQDLDAPREIYEDFIDTWDDIYRRERAFLSRFISPPDKKAIKLDPQTSFEDFSKLLLTEAEHSAELYGETRRIINREDPVSAARLYWEELVSMASHSNGRQRAQRPSLQEDSSEDEGEIIEEGEVGSDGEPIKLTEDAEESNPSKIQGEEPEIREENGGNESKEYTPVASTT